MILDIFFHFFCKFLTRHIKKRMTTCKIILTPTTKEPEICHALASTSAFNLKLCHIFYLDLFVLFCTFWIFLGFFKIWEFSKFLGIFLRLLGFFQKLLRLLLKLTEVTTGHQKCPKISIRCSFLPKGPTSLVWRPKPSTRARSKPA